MMALRIRLRDVVTGFVVTLLLVGIFMLWPQTFGGAVSYVMVSGTSMEPGLHTGDLVVTRVQSHYEVGDTVAFRIRDGEPGEGNVVIHRLVAGNEVDGFETQGDNRNYRDPWRPTRDDILGQRWVMIPGIGANIALLRAPIPLGALCGLLTVWVLAPRRKRVTAT
jgi:signal peptidase